MSSVGASDFNTGVAESLKPDILGDRFFSLVRQPLVTDHQPSYPNMVTETFGGWRRWCWQTSHCTAGQWHSLWALADTQPQRGCCSWALIKRTQTRITLLSLHNSFSWQPCLLWSVGSGWFWSLHYSGITKWKGLYNVVQAVITPLILVFIGRCCSRMICLWLLLK